MQEKKQKMNFRDMFKINHQKSERLRGIINGQSASKTIILKDNGLI